MGIFLLSQISRRDVCHRLIIGAVLSFFVCFSLSAQIMEPTKTMPAPDFLLIQPNGEPLSDVPAPGKTRVWVFGFTECGHVCPMMMYNMSKLHASLTSEQQAQLDVVFVTVDPEHDSLQTIAAYVAKFSDQFRAARPSVNDISPWMSAMGLVLAKEASAPANARYNHTPRIVVQDDRGYLRAFWPSDISHNDMAADLEQLRRESVGFSAWLRRTFL